MSNETQSLARQRIDTLLDENSFVEIGARVIAKSTNFKLSKKSMYSDGIITGYGVVNNSLVYVYSQDVSILNGTIGEMHAKKIVNLYKLAMKMGAPVIGLIDCAGLRLEEAMDALNSFGEIYMVQVDASGVIPQITGIFGICGGGMALIPALTDFTFMEEKNAKLFVNSPNALEGNIDFKCDTASAAFQSEEAGLIDWKGSEREIIGKMRHLLSLLPSNNTDDIYEECKDDLNRRCPDLRNCMADPALLLARISDNQLYMEAKATYGKDMVTAFIKLNGITVGAVANRTVFYDTDGNVGETYEPVISPRGAKKAAKFIMFCDAFSIPIITFTNLRGYQATKCSETHMAKAAAKLIYAFASATVPKVNVITGEAFGSAYLIMNSKSVGADLVYAWKNAKIGMMDAKEAAKIMYAGADGVVIKEKTVEYDALKNNVESAAEKGYVDTVIEAEDSRKYIIGALEMLYTKKDYRSEKKHGTV